VFEQECGVGVVITPDQVEAAVEDVIGKHKAGLQAQRYKYNMGVIMGNYLVSKITTVTVISKIQ
jgi:glutaminyl-tRNA synthetase